MNAGFKPMNNDRHHIEADFSLALEEGEFELRYQPIVGTATREIWGMETLVRWLHPTRGKIQPDYFIRNAEQTSAIVPLGNWILRNACSDAASWPKDIIVAVNVSAIQLQHGHFAGIVSQVLEETQLDPSRLEIEITETTSLFNSESSLETLNRLRDLGIRIAMDDFGIGYSSLSYFSNFPFGKIKLDKSFVQNFEEPESRAIIGAVAGIGDSLNLMTCAEGIETQTQFEFIRSQGYTHMQGFLFGKPQSQAATIELLSSLGDTIAP